MVFSTYIPSIKPFRDTLTNLGEWTSAAQAFLRSYWASSNVMIVGPAGVGKTNIAANVLGAKMSDEAKKWSNSLTNEYDARINDTISKKTNQIIVIDTPGDEEHRRELDNALAKAVAGHVDGIINVVAYGYHYTRRQVQHGGLPVIEAGSPDAGPGVELDAGFLARQREVEDQFLDRLYPVLSGASGLKWVLNAVAKPDLYAMDRAILDYYSPAGEYGRKVYSLASAGRRMSTEFVCGDYNETGKYAGLPVRGAVTERAEMAKVNEKFKRAILDLMGAPKFNG